MTVNHLSTKNRGKTQGENQALVRATPYRLAHKSNFTGHVIITTGLRTMHYPRPGIFSEMGHEPVAG